MLIERLIQSLFLVMHQDEAAAKWIQIIFSEMTAMRRTNKRTEMKAMMTALIILDVVLSFISGI